MLPRFESAQNRDLTYVLIISAGAQSEGLSGWLPLSANALIRKKNRKKLFWGARYLVKITSISGAEFY